MTANELIKRFNELPINTYPPYPPQPVTINGDRWEGQQVVRVADLVQLVGELARELEEGR